MTHKKCSPGLIHICLLTAVVLTLAVPPPPSGRRKRFTASKGAYGTRQAGGPPTCAAIGNYCDTVYELTPPAKPSDPWIKTLNMFKGRRADGGEVPDGLIIDTVGNLYGVTEYGGTGDCVLLGVKAGCGTVYKLSPSKKKGGTWKGTILYSFPIAKQGYVPNGD
jgi:hypothetical protein